MAKEFKRIPNFDEIVFAVRNKEYGSYVLRKKYNNTLIVASLIGIFIIATAIITPYLNAKATENKGKRAERQVEIKMENLDQPVEKVAPPPDSSSSIGSSAAAEIRAASDCRLNQT